MLFRLLEKHFRLIPYDILPHSTITSKNRRVVECFLPLTGQKINTIIRIRGVWHFIFHSTLI